MSVNRHRPHLLILPEDDATRQIANGFWLKARNMRVLPQADGWPNVLSTFRSFYIQYLRTYAHAQLVLFIDFDQQFSTRFSHFQQAIPQDIANRVYVLGAATEAETLTKQVKLNKEDVGKALADECLQETDQLWRCPELAPDAPEVKRICVATKAFLF